PARYSSTTTVSYPAACVRAASRSGVTATPLPAASPSAFTTYGGPNSSNADATAAGSWHGRHRAVGTPAAAITSLANDFEPSSRAAAADGPKQWMPLARTASTAPATSGASGPITTRSAPTSTASEATAVGSVGDTSGYSRATAPMPGLPGAATRSVTAGSAASRSASACSRPPEPHSSTRTISQPTPLRPGPVAHAPPRTAPGRSCADVHAVAVGRSGWRVTFSSRPGPTPATLI